MLLEINSLQDLKNQKCRYEGGAKTNKSTKQPIFYVEIHISTTFRQQTTIGTPDLGIGNGMTFLF